MVMGAKKADPMKSATAANLENSIGTSEKRKKVGQVEGALHAANDTRSGMKTRLAAEVAIRNRRMRLKSQRNTERDIFTDDVPRLEEAAERVLENSLEMSTEAQLDAESGIRVDSEGRLEELAAGVVSLREEGLAVVIVSDKGVEPENVQKNAEDSSSKTNRGGAIRGRHRNLSELKEPTRKGEKSGLDCEVAAAQTAKEAGKALTIYELAKEEKPSVSTTEGESDITMHAYAAQDQDEDRVSTQGRGKLKLEKALSALEGQKRKVEQDLIAMEKEADDRRKHQQAQKKELDLAQGDFERVRCMSLQDVIRAVKKNNGLENELISMREEKTRLRASLETVLKNLEEEKEKRLCQICLEAPKDTICFPCLHLNFCFACLDTHRGQNNSCPSCRTAVTGVLRCDICM